MIIIGDTCTINIIISLHNTAFIDVISKVVISKVLEVLSKCHRIKTYAQILDLGLQLNLENDQFPLRLLLSTNPIAYIVAASLTKKSVLQHWPQHGRGQSEVPLSFDRTSKMVLLWRRPGRGRSKIWIRRLLVKML